MIDETSTLPVVVDAPRRGSTVAELAQIPEEEIWLSKQKSARTRRAYRLDVRHFTRTLGITTPGELRQTDHKALAINPQTTVRLRAYLEAAGHGTDIDGPLFRPLRHNGTRREEQRGMDPDAIDRVTRKYAAALGLDRGYSAHSMRATFIITALENGAQLEDVQKSAGHRDPSTTKLYDRRGYNPEKAASFFATD